MTVKIQKGCFFVPQIFELPNKLLTLLIDHERDLTNDPVFASLHMHLFSLVGAFFVKINAALHILAPQTSIAAVPICHKQKCEGVP